MTTTTPEETSKKIFDPKGVEITEGTYPLDSEISSRDRSARIITFIAFAVGVPVLGFVLGILLANLIFEASIAGWIGGILGLGLGALAFVAVMEKFFIIRNNTTSVFLTIDQLATLLGRNNPYVLYGAGTHLSLPWEKRLEENNVSLEEVAGEVNFTVQCKDGILTGTGSYRLRATPERIVPFLLGVASVAGEISDLIEKSAAEFFNDKMVLKAVRTYTELNEYLFNELVEGTSDIERRFGIDLTDVTINRLLPTKELQRAITAQAEAVAVQKGVLKLLHCTSSKDLERKLASGTLSQADLNFALDRFLSMSGNLEGVNITRNEIDFKIEGLDPEVVKDLKDLVNSPGGKAMAAAYASKVGSKEKKGKKGGDS